MAGQDLYCVKRSERFIRRIKRCRALGCAHSPSGVGLSPTAEGVLLRYGSKKWDGETPSPMERGNSMEMGTFGGQSGRHGCLCAEQLSEKFT